MVQGLRLVQPVIALSSLYMVVLMLAVGKRQKMTIRGYGHSIGLASGGNISEGWLG